MGDNRKKILCKNIISNGFCKYSDKCMYAHSLDEQNVSENRRHAYEILRNILDNKKCGFADKSMIDKMSYDTLKELTNVCPMCVKKMCTGGYNCKFGVCDEKYCVCYDNLFYGKCNKQLKEQCNKIHIVCDKKGIVDRVDRVDRVDMIDRIDMMNRMDNKCDKQDFDINVNSDDDDVTLNIEPPKLINEFTTSIFA